MFPVVPRELIASCKTPLTPFPRALIRLLTCKRWNDHGQRQEQMATHQPESATCWWVSGKGCIHPSWKTPFPKHSMSVVVVVIIIFKPSISGFTRSSNLELSTSVARASPLTGEGSIFIYLLFPGALWPPKSRQKGNVLFSSEPQTLLVYFSPEHTVIYRLSLFSLLPPLPASHNCSQVAAWPGRQLRSPRTRLLPVRMWVDGQSPERLQLERKGNITRRFPAFLWNTVTKSYLRSP